MKRNITTVIGVAALLATFAFAQDTRVIRTASMTGTGSGKAKHKLRVKNNETQVEFEMEAEDLKPNSTYNLQVSNWASITVLSNNFGSLSVERRWTVAPFPAVNPGDSITLTNGAGDTVLSGTFH